MGMFVCLAGSTGVLAQTPQPDQTTATYGSWTLSCRIHAASKVQAGADVVKTSTGEAKGEKRVKLCEVTQRYSGPTPAELAFAPSKKHADKTIASFRTPVDVYLPFNPSIAVDDKEIAKGRFLRCRGRACIANFVFDDAAVSALAASKSGTLSYKQSTGALQNIPISGAGLKNALAAYKAALK
ncbi:MAG: invasion associated locus B family protein [Pseudomonadota bacterium]